MSLPRYPEYKDSGMKWLGHVPAHWSIQRADSLIETHRKSMDADTISGFQVFHYSIPNVQELGDGKIEDGLTIDSSKFIISEKQILISKLNPRKGTCCIAEPNTESEITLCSTEFVPLIPKGIHFSFMFRVIQTEEYRCRLESLVESVTRSHQRVLPEAIIKFFWAFPPLPEQSSIAAFLDRETAKIDALVAEQEKLIELLKEKRQAVISHAVTKGLDPNVPMKDSGVEWLGEVPEHWTACPLRRLLTSIEQGSSPQSESSPALPGEPAIIKLSAIKNGSFEATENKALTSMQSIDPRHEVRANDLLVTRANTLDLVGASCIVHSNIPEKLFLPDLVYRLSLRSEITPQFLNYFFQSSSARSQISADARGSSMTMAKISQGHIKCWWVTLPPRAEQDQITSFLEGENRQFDELMVEAQRAIDLLKERRSALISAAITGKIDVRDK